MDSFFGKCLNGAADIVIAFAFFVSLMERRSKNPLPLILTILAGSVCEFFFLPPGDDMTLLFMIPALILLRNNSSGKDDVNSADALLAAAGYVTIYAASLAAMYLFCVICEKYRRRKQAQLSEQSYDQFREQMILQKENTLALNKFRHDIINHLIDIRALVVANDTDSALMLLDETARKAEEAWAEPLSTGDPIADVVIASKSAVCRSKGIEFICKTESMDDFKMDLVDMSSLISNLLDNAIEAAEKTESPYVKLDIFDHNAYHVIRVKNSISEEVPAPSGNFLSTTKSEADLHGFGLKIIEDIAEKYGGNFVMKKDGDRFIATVLIKIHLKNGV